jgi:hypothetical protein
MDLSFYEIFKEDQVFISHRLNFREGGRNIEK